MQIVKKPDAYEVSSPPRITGRGGGKDGGSNSTSSGVEAPNSLRSKQYAKVIDLLSEGPIEGVVNGAKGVYFDGVAVQRSDGKFNFGGLTIQFRNGTQSQPVMTGFTAAESETGVSLELKKGFPLVRHISNTDVDRVRFTVSVPSLTYTNKDTGDVSGTSVGIRPYISTNGGPFVQFPDIVITGKTTSNYQKDVIFTLPKTPTNGPWDIKLDRMHADSTTQYLQNQTFWDSYTEMVDDGVRYANSAVVGVSVDAEQFRSIPKRVYDTEGLLVRVPSNYNPRSTSYGPAMYSPATWDGTFKSAWTDNPAWILFDLLANNRYGLAGFLGGAGSVNNLSADKWSFYKVGQWCDAGVRKHPTISTLERRYTCNIQIRDQQEAFDLLAQLCSIFRGFMYWAGNQLVLVADQPEDPIDQFSNANVINGTFTYSGGDVRDRHTMVYLGWNDPDARGEPIVSSVEDQDGIEQYGIQEVQEQCYGCTRETQAIRQGNWTLFTELHEDESVKFTTGMQGGYLRPGNIIKVMDSNVAGRRRGGRITQVSGPENREIYFDAPVFLEVGKLYVMSCVVPDGETQTVQTRNMITVLTTGYYDHYSIVTAFSAPPPVDSIFVITTVTLDATLWRVMAVKQSEREEYDIEGVRHYPLKWDVVERNYPFREPDVTDIKAQPDPVTNLGIKEYILQTSAISLQVMLTFSWTSKAPLFDVFYHRINDNWSHVRTDQHAVNLPVTGGEQWEFQVTPIGNLGLKGPVSPTLKYTVIGLLEPPATPTGFKVRVDQGIAMFTWNASDEIDVKIGGHYELRFSPATSGATWNTAQMVLPAIPGTASSVETSYQSGTWLLRAFDIDGRASPSWAAIIALATDLRYVEFFRICEDPGWTGTHDGTEIQTPQQWLVIGATGGLWDEQLSNMSTWPDVDVLPIPSGAPRTANQGTYSFFRKIDAGGVFSVRLTADILAFPFYIDSETVDDRAGLVDTWDNWDDAGTGLGGTITIMISSTVDDPALPAAVWTPYERFVPGEYYARAWRFQAVLAAPEGQNIGVETLCITGDFVSKADAAEDVVYAAVEQRVYFRIKFFNLPAIVVTLQLAMAEDRVEIVRKTTTYFDIKITMTTSGTNPIDGSRKFDWHARGY